MGDVLWVLFCLLLPGALGVVAAVQAAQGRRAGTVACPRCGHRNLAHRSSCFACGGTLPTSSGRIGSVPPPPLLAPSSGRTLAVPAPAVRAPVSAPPAAPDDPPDADHIRWLLTELDRPEVAFLLGWRAEEGLRAHYLARLTPPAPAAAAEFSLAPAAGASPVAPDAVPVPAAAVAPPVVVVPVPEVVPAPVVLAAAAAPPAPLASSAAPPETPSEPVAPPAPVPAEQPFWETVDRAVVLLYLGAFLVVVAGLVYSTNNWDALGGWQRVLLLTAATAGFAGGGVALLRFPRVRPAAETFVGIGALLLPMNVLAVRGLEAGGNGPVVRPAVTYELAALTVAILYACFSFRPGGAVYRAGTVAAALLALVALPAAAGLAGAWGAVPVALAAVAAPDFPRRLRGRARRFVPPAVRGTLVALPAAVALALVALVGDGRGWLVRIGLEGARWPLPLALVAATLALGRLAARRGSAGLMAGAVAGSAATALAVLMAARGTEVDAAAVAALLAVGWLGAAERGPSLLRRSPVRDLVHGGALTLLAFGPLGALWAAPGADGEGRWVLAGLGWAAATAGAGAVARVRRAPAFGALAAVFATLAYVTVGVALPEGNGPAGALALALLPAPLGLAGAAWVLGRWRGGRVGRVWSRPVWAVAGAEALLVTWLAAVRAVERWERYDDEFVLLAVALPLAGAAYVAARQLRSVAAFVAAVAWLECAAVVLVAGVPVYRGAAEGPPRTGLLERLEVAPLQWDAAHAWPALVVLGLGVAAVALAAPLPAGRAWDRRAARRAALAAPGAVAGVALVLALGATGAYVLDPGRPPTATPYPGAGWWWPYLIFWALATLGAVPAGRRLGRVEGATVVAALAGVAAALGLRMAFGALNLDPLRWPPVVVALGTGAAGVALSWRARGRFDRALRARLAWLAAGFAGVALAAMLAATAVYAADLGRPATSVPHPESGWWWPYLAAYLAVAGGGVLLGRRTGSAVPAVPVAVAATAAEVLALRMAYERFAPDGWHWLPVVGLVGLATLGLAGLAALDRRSGQFGPALGRWLGGGGAGLAAPALLGAGALTVAYVLDVAPPFGDPAAQGAAWWWPFLALFLGAAALALAAGPRARRPLPDLAPAAVAALGAALTLGLRMAYATAPLDRWTWLVVLVGAGGAVAAVAAGAGRRLGAGFAARVARGGVLLGGAVGAVGHLGAVGLTLLYGADLDIGGSAPGVGWAAPQGDEPGWWWRVLALHVAVAAGAWWVGRRARLGHWQAAAVAVAAHVLLAEVLALRMGHAAVRVPGPHWLAIVAAVGLATIAGAALLARRPAGSFDFSLARTLAGAGGVLGGPPLLGALVLVAVYVLDVWPPFGELAAGPAGWWWPFAALSLGVAATAGVAGPRALPPVPDLAPAMGGALTVAAALALRMGYAAAPLDRWSWLALAAGAGAALAAGGAVLRGWAMTGETAGGPERAFAARVGRNLFLGGGALGGFGLLGAAGATLVHAGEVLVVGAAGGEVGWGGPGWRWPLVALFLVVAGGATVAGWRLHARARDVGAALGLGAVAAGALAALLALRMATADPVAWTYALGGAVGLGSVLRAARPPLGSTPVARAVAVGLTVLGLAAGAWALAANLALTLAGRTDPGPRAAAYAVVAAALLWVGVRERRPALGYGAAGAAAVAAWSAGAAAGLERGEAAAPLALLAWALVAGALSAPFRGRWSGWAPVWERCAYAVALVPLGVGLAEPGAFDPGSAAYGRLTLLTLSLAGQLAAVAFARGRVVQVYAASALGLAGTLLQVAAFGPDNVQAYTVPSALYPLVVGWTRRDREPRAFDALVGAGAALLLVPPFAQSFGPGDAAWALVCGAEALALVLVGLALGRRTPVAAGVVGLTAVALRQTVDYANAVPTWVLMGAVGAALLLAGTLSLVAREALLGHWDAARARWTGLR